MPRAPKKPPRRGSFEDKLARIGALADAPPQAALPELRRFLTDASGYLTGDAAAVTAKLGLRELIPDLAAAFSRLIAGSVGPSSTDKGCFGKKRVLEALLQLDADVPDVYLAGIRYEQREPSFPDFIDTASPIRSLSAHALFQIHHPGAVHEVTPLLMDAQPDVRTEAASALGSSGVDLAAPILHLKVLTGDREPDVLGACFKGLLRLAPPRYLPVVSRHLVGDDAAVAEAAALALGESRLREAFPILKDRIESGVDPTLDDSILLGIALLRSDEGNDYLFSLVGSAPERRAALALTALALHRHDPRITERARQWVATRGSRRLGQVLAEKFGAPT